MQTAVLGNAESDEPVLLPLEAFELAVFRRQHDGDTYWCGLLLGGCGGKLRQKLYTDRVCHFAHNPDPEGIDNPCRRSARGVSSADHLYVKQQTDSWLRAQGHEPHYRYNDPHTAPIGSLVEIGLPRGGRLRVHLNPHLPPDWDDEEEAGEGTVDTVVGMEVPVDPATLVRRRYVHRIHLRPEGLTRTVRIGTEAFARDTEWFGLGDCALTPRGLWTPAVERILQERQAPPPVLLAGGSRHHTEAGTAEETREAALPAAARQLIRQLASAQRTGALAQAATLCEKAETLAPTVTEEARPELTAVLDDTRTWLDKQHALRSSLFDRLETAVAEGKTHQVRTLLSEADEVAGTDRSRREDAVAQAAHSYLTDLQRSAGWQARDTAPRPRGPKLTRRGRRIGDKLREEQAHRTLRELLSTLRRRGHAMPAAQLGETVSQLSKAAAAAGNGVTSNQRTEVAEWTAHYREVQKNPSAPPRKPASAAGRPVTRVRPPQPRQETPPPPSQVRPAPPETPPTAARQPPSAPQQREKSRSGKRTSSTPRVSADVVTSTAAAVRGALKKAAREQATTSWAKLRRQLGTALPRLHPEDQAAVLAEVDRETPRQEPLLSALLATSAHNEPDSYRRLAEQLGRQAPAGGPEAHAYWQREALRLHQAWRHR